MTLSRYQQQPSNAPTIKLYKDIWIKFILPKLEKNDLLKLSAVSKQARQAAWVELLKRPQFKTKLDSKIARHTELGKSTLFDDKAWFGATKLPNVLRGVQIWLLFVSAILLEITYYTYKDGYPSPDAVEAAIRAWRASPSHDSEFDSPPTILLMNRFPNDNCRTLSLMIMSVLILSFICRSLFKYTNHAAIETAYQERAQQANHRLKATRLTYLRDQLPKETITTYSLFAKVKTSDNNEGLLPHWCHIL